MRQGVDYKWDDFPAALSGKCTAEGLDAGGIHQRLRGRHIRAERLGERQAHAERHYHGQGGWLGAAQMTAQAGSMGSKLKAPRDDGR